MAIMLGADDRSLMRVLAKKCGKPVTVLDTEFSLLQRLSPSVRCVKLCSTQDEIVRMYISDLVEKTEKMPVLCVQEKYKDFLERNEETLSALCVLWREELEF